jgi:hypothetical protein
MSAQFESGPRNADEITCISSMCGRFGGDRVGTQIEPICSLLTARSGKQSPRQNESLCNETGDPSWARGSVGEAGYEGCR